MTATSKDKQKYKLIREQADTTIESPCIGVCEYDDTEEFCMGCYRSVEDLQKWWIYTKEEKEEALKKIAIRRTGV